MFSDSDARNPMVAGFAEDIDSEDETTVLALTNHVNDGINSRELTRTNRLSAVVTVELTSSEEEEKEEGNDEEEKQSERVKREKGNDRINIKEDEEIESETVELSLEIPVKSFVMDSAVDGFGLGTEDVDDWLNSPDSDPKVQFLSEV